MSAISRQQQKEFARTLYLRENLTQAEIAERVGVSRQTIIRWMAAEKWDELKASISMTAEEQIARLEELAYFQEKLLSQLNEALTGQQKQLDMLEKRLAELEENVTTLMNAQDGPVNTLPPHYMPERY